MRCVGGTWECPWSVFGSTLPLNSMPRPNRANIDLEPHDYSQAQAPAVMTPVRAVEAACPEPAPHDFLFVTQRDVGGSQDVSCGGMGNRTLADVAEMCWAAAPDCAAFTYSMDQGGAPQYCLKSGAAPLTDMSTTSPVLDPCMGAYILSELSLPLECLVCMSCYKANRPCMSACWFA